ncbi:uncharacterized protein LOC101459469 [Ceratitis capitata]|uniref:ZAD domain-containing protein n=1 Tax=Ceratitis capitata TaxID=7213 RepID=W8AKJ3_CERCA|nr:uncharacterized protein LOC101459469 [Ceratitis capitata]
MTCRLCLHNTDNLLSIFTDNGDIAKKVVVDTLEQHLKLKIQFNDKVSNKICLDCWQHIQNFHTFWLRIDEKQRSLETILDCPQIKQEKNVEYNSYEHVNSVNKDNLLIEPELNINDIKNEHGEGMRVDSPLLFNVPAEVEDVPSTCTFCGRSTSEYLKLKEILQTQNKTVLETLQHQSVLIHSLVRQEEVSSSALEEFPIDNREQLEEIDAKINEDNRDTYVRVMKSIIRNQINKNIKSVLTEKLIMDFNLDGTHGKGRLKDYKNFYGSFREAVETFDPERSIRHALQLAKKRYFQSTCTSNKKMKFAE